MTDLGPWLLILDPLRLLSMTVWSAALWVFSPGAARALNGSGDKWDQFWLAACFSCMNRITFGLTAIFAPEFVVLSQAFGILAALWLVVVGHRLVRR